MNFKKAKQLSIKKWELVITNDGKFALVRDDKELSSLTNMCPFCHRYNRNCLYCELSTTTKGCNAKGHPYKIWLDNKTKENAQKVLEFTLRTRKGYYTDTNIRTPWYFYIQVNNFINTVKNFVWKR